MTRIGFAYNQKPEPTPSGQRATSTVSSTATELPSGDDEPPSRHRIASSAIVARNEATQQSPAAVADDEFAEWDTPETIDAVAHALSALGTVIRLEATPEFPDRLRAAKADIVFNMAEGLRGKNRESLVPAICEFYGIPYSGSDPFTLSLCLDKARTKEILSYYRVPTAPFVVVDGGFDEEPSATRDRLDALEYPLFVKPIHEGSSKGITEKNFCRTPDELTAQVQFLLHAYAQPVLIEEFLSGAEFTCAVLGNGSSVRVLPLVGMNFAALPAGALPVYGFEAKWVWDNRESPIQIFDCPAKIPDALRTAIEDVVLRAYRVLGCRDWSRIDVRLDARGVPNVVEVNPLPGILPNPDDHSCFPKAARAAGLSYDELIQTCLTLAAERHGVRLT